MQRLRVKERRNNLQKESRFFRDSFVENSGVNFSFNRKVTKEIPHVLVAGAKTSLFAKIYTSLLRLLTVATFQNFFDAHRSSFTYALRNVRSDVEMQTLKQESNE